MMAHTPNSCIFNSLGVPTQYTYSFECKLTIAEVNEFISLLMANQRKIYAK